MQGDKTCPPRTRACVGDPAEGNAGGGAPPPHLHESPLPATFLAADDTRWTRPTLRPGLREGPSHLPLAAADTRWPPVYARPRVSRPLAAGPGGGDRGSGPWGGGTHRFRAPGARRWHTTVVVACFPPLPSSCRTSHCRGSLVRALSTFTPFFTLALREEGGREGDTG